jgi:signal transduction histidine kinase/CheY-like chemotaxis protein
MLVPNLTMVILCGACALCAFALAWRFHARNRALEEKVRHIQSLAADATHALQRQGRLTKEVAHELRNPITAIVCAADSLEFLLRDDVGEPELAALRHIKDHGEYVLKLMNDFIDLTRGASGQLSSVREALLVHNIVGSVVGLLEPSAGRKGITIEVMRSEESLWVEVDPKHLKQILFNLVQNSIKFTPAGGKVVVWFGVGPDSESVSIEVQDTGIGISDQELERVFDPLWHLQRQRIPDEVGSGLGLALTKTLVELEGGGIFISSTKDKGTSVRVILNRAAPKVQQPAAVEETLDTAGARPLSGQSVLIVESDPVIRDTLMRVIEKLGAAVDGVGMAIDAVHAVHKNTYSAVVIDEGVDTMSSYELAEIVRRELPEDSGRVFIACGGPAAERVAKDGVVSGTIEKPLGPKAVLDALMPD